MSVPSALRSAFLCLFWTVIASGSDSTRLVTDCVQLQDALNASNVTRILVEGTVRCTRESWQVPVIVQRTLEISGDPRETNGTRGFVDWTDTRNVVIAERVSITIHDIALQQKEMGMGGLDLDFIHAREGAAAIFSGVLVFVQSCSQPVWTYSELMTSIDRPSFMTQGQRTRPLGSKGLLIQDLAVWWPNLNAVWQLCNSVMLCLNGVDENIEVEDYFLSTLVVNSCAVIPETTDDVVEKLSANIPEGEPIVMNSPEATTDKDEQMSNTILTLIVVLAAVVFVAAAVMFRCAWSGRRGELTSCRSGKDHLSVSGSPRDGVSSRYLQNKNDMDLHLFGKGTNVPLQDVAMGSLLGRGGFGKVYKGTWKGTSVAIKVIEHGERLIQNDLKLPFEAYLSKHISHPNVVQTFLIHTRQKDSQNGVTVDTRDFRAESPGSAKKSVSAGSMDVFSNMGSGAAAGRDAGDIFETWLVLEFCDRGSLSQAVHKGSLLDPDTEEPLLDHILLSALDVANAMNYLHTLGITHGDLKAENVLLKSASTDRRGFFCKVSDFGLSRYVGDEDVLQTFTYGTVTHMPPELLKDGAFSTAVDVYSFGVLLWELLALTPPYPDTNHGHILMTVVAESRRPQITDRYPQMYADLIKDCWKQNAEDRPKFSVIVKRLKDMLAALDLGNRQLKNVNDSATSQGTSFCSRADVHRATFVSSVPVIHSNDSTVDPSRDAAYVSESESGRHDRRSSLHRSLHSRTSAGSFPSSNGGFSSFGDQIPA